MQQQRPETVVNVRQDVETIKAEQEQAKRERLERAITGK